MPTLPQVSFTATIFECATLISWSQVSTSRRWPSSSSPAVTVTNNNQSHHVFIESSTSALLAHNPFAIGHSTCLEAIACQTVRAEPRGALVRLALQTRPASPTALISTLTTYSTCPNTPSETATVISKTTAVSTIQEPDSSNALTSPKLDILLALARHSFTEVRKVLVLTLLVARSLTISEVGPWKIEAGADGL